MRKTLIISMIYTSSWLLALLPNEIVHTQAIYNQYRQILIQKGAEDGVFKGEFVRIVQNGRYKSRAISIQVGLKHSLWALYNRYEPIKTMSPVIVKKSARHRFSLRQKKELNLRPMSSDKFVTLTTPRERQNQKKEELFVYKAPVKESKVYQSKQEEYVEGLIRGQGYNLKDPITLKLQVSPFTIKNINNSKSYSYGVEVSQDTEMERALKYDYQRTSYVDTFRGSSLTTSYSHALANYEYHKVSDRMSLFAFATFERDRYSNLYPIRVHTNVGPVGIKYKFLSNKPWLKHMDISYIPVIDYFKRDVLLNAGGTNETFFQQTDTNLRHAFRFRIKTLFEEYKLKVGNTTYLRPLQEVDTLIPDFGDRHFEMSTNADYLVNKNFSIGYINKIVSDERRFKHSTLPTTEIAHTFHVSYETKF